MVQTCLLNLSVLSVDIIFKTLINIRSLDLNILVEEFLSKMQEDIKDSSNFYIIKKNKFTYLFS